MAEPVNVASQIIGNGPPLLILHGLFGSGRNWGGIARQLTDRYAVHLLDARNHGSSPWTTSMIYSEMAEDVATYIAANRLEAVDLIGHSMGGKTAMTLALDQPTLIRRLAIVDIAPVPYRGGSQDSYRGYIEAMRALDVAHLRRRHEADNMLAAAIPDSAMRSFLTQNLESNDDGYRWRINLDTIEKSLPELTDFPVIDARFEGPVTVIAGELSNYVRPRDEPAIRAYFPKSRIEVIDGSGHWPHVDQPERLLKLITLALASNPTARS